MVAPTISIITIVLNQSKDIEKTIQSVLQQSQKKLEYIVVDGGSTDGTLDVIYRYKDSIAQVISSVDVNTSDAMNKGIKASSGDIIGMIFAGDSYGDDDVLHRVAKLHGQHPEAILHGNIEYWRINGESAYISTARDDSAKAININHLAAFVPRTVYDAVGMYDLTFSHANDYEFYLRAKVKGIEFVYLDETWANMVAGGNSDEHWIANYREITRARILHNQGLIQCYLRLGFMLVRTITRKALESIGAARLVKLYRYYLSPVQKYSP